MTAWCCFKAELLRTWYGLSNGEVEEQMNNRLSFNRFVGLVWKTLLPTARLSAVFGIHW